MKNPMLMAPRRIIKFVRQDNSKAKKPKGERWLVFFDNGKTPLMPVKTAEKTSRNFFQEISLPRGAPLGTIVEAPTQTREMPERIDRGTQRVLGGILFPEQTVRLISTVGRGVSIHLLELDDFLKKRDQKAIYPEGDFGLIHVVDA